MTFNVARDTRNRMSLNRAVRAAGAALLGLMMLCGGTGIGASWMQSVALERQHAASELLANHQLADMMHDAIRADVLAAFEATDARSGLKRSDILIDYASHLKGLRTGIRSDAEYVGPVEVTSLTSRLERPMEAYVNGATRIIEQVGRDPGEAKATLPAFFNQFRVLEISMAEASDAIAANATKALNTEKMIGTAAMVVLLITMILAIAGTIAVVMLAMRHVILPISVLAETMRKLGSGNLAADVAGADRGDELGDIAKAMLAFRNQLQRTTASKQAQADAILVGSREIAQASEDLARRTESNAASLEQTSAALIQIDGRLKASVVASAQTVSRADQAITTVDSGRATAGEAVAAMDRVRDSAKSIDDVIGGLDKIAFQTRVLAMNAAVEAGRAGDAGRGFAVVADLVSALAMRAEEEAKRARNQLTVTQAEVVTAVAAVQKVDGALSAISDDVGHVHSLLKGMAADNEAQATGISQITVAVSEMDKSTQQNAAMVEETSAAARNLSAEVSELSAQTASLDTGDQGSGARRSDRAPPVALRRLATSAQAHA